jgi:murein DD-endopeptidase MepM/ murein hydrolase activator NlpD
MSHSSHHPHHRTTGHATRQGHGHARSAAAVSQHLNRAHAAISDYTLVHGGHQVRIGPVAFWIVVGTLIIMAVWSLGTGTYFAFREDILSSLVSRQARMQIAYEDRIAELRGEVDRITSRQLLDQNQFEHRLDVLLKRQAMLERRTMALADDGLTTGSIPRGKREKDAQLEAPIKASPISDTVVFSAPPEREARLQSREAPQHLTSLASAESAAGLDGVLARVSHSLDRVAQHQAALLNGMEQHYDSKAHRMRSVLSELGVKPGRPSAEGGPFIPVKPPHAGASSFDRQLYRVNIARAEVNHYRRKLVAVPVRKPLPGRLDVTSSFGVRRDPFLGKPAMHTGLDLRGEIGEPVHATAAGKVEIAGWDGGYGNLVEIDHGNGLSTRFGHLSKILVKVGQKVHIGQVIGLVGSTGRSTGPHLHYETRIRDEAVDPQKFLRAGVRLGSL